MELTTVKANNGKTTRLWKDKWLETSIMEDFPHLFSFAKDQDCSLHKFQSLGDEDIYENFHLPVSIVDGQERDELSQII